MARKFTPITREWIEEQVRAQQAVKLGPSIRMYWKGIYGDARGALAYFDGVKQGRIQIRFKSGLVVECDPVTGKQYGGRMRIHRADMGKAQHLAAKG